MAMTKPVLLTELDYTIWANHVVLHACTALTAAELTFNIQTSHSSIIRTLRHMYDAERSWIANLISDSIPSIAEIEAAGAADQSRPDPPLESLLQLWPNVWENAHRWIAPLNDEDLTHELTCRLRNGGDLRLPRWKVLLHMANHSTQHRGQIISMFRALGKQPPPNTDLLNFYQLGK